MRDETTQLQMRHRTLMTLWLALLMNVLVLFSMTLFLPPPEPAGTGNLGPIFIAIAVLTIIASFIAKGMILNRARDEQNLQLVHVAFVIAWAMCELSALLGLLEYVMFGSRNLVLFGVSFVGIGLHLPRIEHLERAGMNK